MATGPCPFMSRQDTTPTSPAPLVIVLHGYGSSGQDHDAYFHLGSAAAQRGFLYAYPDGTFDSGGNRFWNATDACCDFDRTGVADVAYLTDVITEIRAHSRSIRNASYLLGHSNGGFMSYAHGLRARRPDRGDGQPRRGDVREPGEMCPDDARRGPPDPWHGR